MKSALITGVSGFVGFHVARKLLKNGYEVFGIDDLNAYYSPELKKRRQNILKAHGDFTVINKKIETTNLLSDLFSEIKPEIVIHLAAQAGVRYSLENPRAYLNSNIIGSFELFEAAKKNVPKHLLLASTSSVYGSNAVMPYKETEATDRQLSFYASTKKSIENMAHSYSHLQSIPITAFRFFTVYGPWGRPDMAPMKFADAILNNREIDVYNFGKMKRDFTYIDDLTEAIYRLISVVPSNNENGLLFKEYDSLSPVAPYRVVNIGNSQPIKLMDFISCLEECIGLKAIKNFMPLQPGDVLETWADTRLLKSLTDFSPNTSLETGVAEFIDWYTTDFKN